MVIEPSSRIVIDLEQLSSVPADKAAPLARYAATIQSQRGDYNGRVLSIRHEDMRSLAVIYDASPTALTEQLIGWGVLSPEARRASADSTPQPMSCSVSATGEASYMIASERRSSLRIESTRPL